MIPSIPEPILDLLHEIGEVGGKGTYLVGGFVRDLLLKRPSLDIDIVVEEDATRVANAMCQRWNGTLETHPQFGTATVTPADANLPKVDFVTARRETYQGAGTLPTVSRGTITDDLRRRDFSINALAMCLDTSAFGEIVDKTGGLEDLKTETIRVLHKHSFTDDPTRIFRAFRYAGRYGFSIPETDTVLMREALPVLAQLSGERIRNEIDRILIEKNASEIVAHLTRLDVWETISQGWNISTTFACDFKKAAQATAWISTHLKDEEFQPELVRWMAFFGIGTPIYQIEALSFRLVLEHQLQRLISRVQASQQQVSLEKVTHDTFAKLGISLSDAASVDQQSGKWRIVDPKNTATYVCGDGNLYRVETPLTAYKQLEQTLATVQETVKPSEIYQLLKSYPIEAFALGYVDTTLPKWKREKIKDYLFVLRKIEPFITGKDLIMLGEKPSKAFETRLWTLFAAQLDGEITKKEEAYSRLRTFV
ncbi:CCA tRNA nucleotidyltransferase [Candidatus Poribacteria bacterium]|nr:CCA tRNA nucleotidyltransferase [Candidatus Poribacteria bacterium]